MTFKNVSGFHLGGEDSSTFRSKEVVWESDAGELQDLVLLGHQLSEPDVISQLEQEELSHMTKVLPGCISPDFLQYCCQIDIPFGLIILPKTMTRKHCLSAALGSSPVTI